MVASVLFALGLWGLLMRRNAVARRMEERMRAADAVASEMAELRAGASAAGLHPAAYAWVSGADVASGLPAAEGWVDVQPFEPGILRVRVGLDWRGGASVVRETLIEARP